MWLQAGQFISVRPLDETKRTLRPPYVPTAKPEDNGTGEVLTSRRGGTKLGPTQQRGSPMNDLTGTRIRQWTASSRVECVEIRPEQALSFVPGHVVTLAAGSAKPGYFAIGSAPSEGPNLRFYLRPGGEAADSVLAARDGEAVRIAGPIAHGFPLEPVVGKDLVFVGVGTGVAPLRSALVEALTTRERYGRLVMVMGAANPAALCCAEEFDSWRAAGVELALTVDEADASWAGATGFVQELLAELDLDPGTTVAHVAGVRAMEEAVRAQFAELGFAPESVRANY